MLQNITNVFVSASLEKQNKKGMLEKTWTFTFWRICYKYVWLNSLT